MKGLREFDIDIFKLSNKKHEYSFEIGDAFFSLFEDSYLDRGKLHVDFVIEKSEFLISSEFRIKGFVTIVCDRSLEDFDFGIDTTNKILFKYGEEYAELTDEIISIPHDTQRLNVAQYIYEFIGLTIPMKKLHPKFQTEIKGESAEEEAETLLIYSTDTASNETEKDEKAEEEIDPRWKILNGLKHNNN